MTTQPRDYYDVLNVPKTVSAADLKKAYRRLARKYHPDLHTGSKKKEMEEKFKELNEAYEVLSDEATRKKYDQYGFEWKNAEAYQRAQQQAGAEGAQGGWETFYSKGEGTDFSDLFSDLFGRRGPRGDASFRGFARPGADLEATVQLSLHEVFSGTMRRLELIDQNGSPSSLNVNIPKGVQDGERVRVKGKGAPGQGGAAPGNLYLRIHVSPHSVFHRDGSHLHVNLPVWPWEAVLGSQVEVPTLEGPVRLTIPPKSQAKHKLRLKGKGLPSRDGGSGDLLVTLEIHLPSSMTAQEEKLYEQLQTYQHPDPRAQLLREASHA